MKIAVTGGTGFVGSHSVAALRRAGHEVRLLVRDPARVAPALTPLGVDIEALELAVGDVTDRASVRACLEGVDAVLHAASIYSFDPRRAVDIAHVNAEGVKNVLELGVELGLDPIVHVSSVLALYRDGYTGEQLHADSPPGRSPWPYSEAKARQDEFARRLQEQGAPVVITNPGGVWGPHDPYDGESLHLARAIAGGRWLFLPPMTVPIVDVRDLAAVHAALMAPGKGPRRYLVASAVEGRELARFVTGALGRPLPVWPAPGFAARSLAVLGDALKRAFGVDLGITGEGVWVGLRRVTVDASRTGAELGVTMRAVEETVRDQLAWMRDAGRL